MIVHRLAVGNKHGDDKRRVGWTGEPSLRGSGPAIESQRRRKLLSLPPYGSYAEVSGPGAKKYVERIDVIEGIEVLGPLEGSWLIKSDSHSLLLETLSKVDRPKERVRVAINS